MFWIQKQGRIFFYNMEDTELDTLVIYQGKLGPFQTNMRWYFGLPDHEDLLIYRGETPIKKCHILYFDPRDSSFIIEKATELIKLLNIEHKKGVDRSLEDHFDNK